MLFEILTRERSLGNEDHNNATFVTGNKGADSVNAKNRFPLLKLLGEKGPIQKNSSIGKSLLTFRQKQMLLKCTFLSLKMHFYHFGTEFLFNEAMDLGMINLAQQKTYKQKSFLEKRDL